MALAFRSHVVDINDEILFFGACCCVAHEDRCSTSYLVSSEVQ
jgi:hypothetical protein